MSRNIAVSVERKICAESMGRCMNPNCKIELFSEKGDIMEKAHIVPYYKTQDNSYENLIILCPNCHTKFDKNDEFDSKDVSKWKALRQEEFKKFFTKRFNTFDEMKDKITPLLLSNKSIYENYYVTEKRELWDVFEGEILSNNRKMKSILEHNTHLIQKHKDDDYSNLALVRAFIHHIDEFEATRSSAEKIRHMLFPSEVNSLFGIEPMKMPILPSVESLECLISVLRDRGEFDSITLGVENPFIQVVNQSGTERIYLNDTPRLRQIYYENRCFRTVDVRFDSLNFALKFINQRKLQFSFLDVSNLRKINVGRINIVFVYEYCLSKVKLQQMFLDEGTVVLNLHNWNGPSCISSKAYEFAEQMNLTLLTMDDFYGFIYELSREK